MEAALLAREPKRKRGHLRVAAIMEAGVALFAAKGYDGTTMAEIAERSGTATASLYRFFPSKEALADALIRQYLAHAIAALTGLRAQATGMKAEALAAALVAWRSSLQAERKFAIALVDARGGSSGQRDVLRKAMRAALADLLAKALPALPATRRPAVVFALQQMLKGVTAAADESPAAPRRAVAELQHAIAVYLRSLDGAAR